MKDSDFKPVALQDRDLFQRHYLAFPQQHSDNTFVNMVCWNHYAHYRFAFEQDCIVLSSTIDGKTRFRPPIGPRDPELLAEVMELSARSDDPHPLVILDPGSWEWISELYPGLELHPERDYFDYVYLASELAELPGKKFQTIRHQLNQFQRQCSPEAMPVNADCMDEVREFLEKWCEWKDCDSEPILANEREAVFFAIDHFQSLQLSGLAIRAEGQIGALSVFERLNESTALVHFEKGLPDCKGIYRAINAETARYLAPDYVYINRESDMGVEGLREAKTRYHPHHLVEVHLVKRDDLERLVL
ncbi:MAG: DUF2156 domain-containing protein [Methanotrichaceae archaeon]|nr:DUF2156 domain-containing protein [Methanotrichaceae archaeon]